MHLNILAVTPRVQRDESIFLDCCRLVSAQFVLWGHLFSFVYGDGFLIGGKIHIQNFGVVIFFILSGYLISKSLSRPQTFGSFFIDRFARIYITLVPCLFLILAMDLLMVKAGVYGYENALNLKTFVGNIFMLQDHPVDLAIKRYFGVDLGFGITSFGSARPLWTIAVEWWLYLFFGYAVLVKRWNPAVLALLAVVPIWYAAVGGGPLTLVWMLGAGLAFLSISKITPRSLVTMLAIFLTMYIGRLLITRDFYDFHSIIFLVCAFGCALAWTRETDIFSRLPSAVINLIRILAGASYALYLLHYSVIEVLRSYGFGSTETIILAVLISNVASIGVYFIFDRRYRQLGTYLKQKAIRTALPQPGIP